MKPLTLHTSDGLPLGACLFEPEQGNKIKAGVIINAATGVKQAFYSRFASHLAAQGYVVLTYDYRGIGESVSLALNDKRLSMLAWGEQDFPAIIDWATDTYPALNWHCIGHSVGGQIIGLAHNHHKLTSSFGVAAQSGNWRNWPFKYQLSFAPVCYALIPTLSRLFGYFPGAIMGGEHLPKHVALEWARWCRHRDYITDKNGKAYRPHFAAVDMLMHFLIIDDDLHFAPEKAVKALSEFYENADTSLSKTSKEERKNRFSGHFGFFRATAKDHLWPKATAWFEKHSSINTNSKIAKH